MDRPIYPILESSESFRSITTIPRIKPGSIGPFRILQQYGPVAYQLKVTATPVVDTQCVSRISAQEVSQSSNRSSRDRSYTTRARSDLSREANQDLGSERTSYSKTISEVVQGAI